MNPEPRTPNRAGPAFRTGLAFGAAGIVDAFLAALFAPLCVCCERVLDQPTRSPVCDACWRNLGRITPPLCEACGEGLPAPGRHGLCPLGGSVLTMTRALGPYEGVLRDLVHAIKFDHRRSLGRRLAGPLRVAASDAFAGADALVPVPLHPWRHWTRGFNQADDLARALAQPDQPDQPNQPDQPDQPGLPVLRALRRIRLTRPQSALDAGARRVNVDGAFRLAGYTSAGRARWQARVTGRVLVLVDDVTTTGATLDAAAVVLRAAGAREVRAVTLARVVLSAQAARTRGAA